MAVTRTWMAEKLQMNINTFNKNVNNKVFVLPAPIEGERTARKEYLYELEDAERFIESVQRAAKTISEPDLKFVELAQEFIRGHYDRTELKMKRQLKLIAAKHGQRKTTVLHFKKEW